MLKNDFFGFPKVKWLHLTGGVVKCVTFSCQIFSLFNVPKIIIIGQFLTKVCLQCFDAVGWAAGRASGL